jgi:hypothetical protein
MTILLLRLYNFYSYSDNEFKATKCEKDALNTPKTHNLKTISIRKCQTMSSSLISKIITGL